jgi:hypothetical protein
MNDWDKILDDFARKCKGGAPDMTNPRHLALLRESLIKFGWKENAMNAFIGNLREAKGKLTIGQMENKLISMDSKKIGVHSSSRRVSNLANITSKQFANMIKNEFGVKKVTIIKPKTGGNNSGAFDMFEWTYNGQNLKVHLAGAVTGRGTKQTRDQELSWLLVLSGMQYGGDASDKETFISLLISNSAVYGKVDGMGAKNALHLAAFLEHNNDWYKSHVAQCKKFMSRVSNKQPTKYVKDSSALAINSQAKKLYKDEHGKKLDLDKWNPADVWLEYSKVPSFNKLAELNNYLLSSVAHGNGYIGVSLKKGSGKVGLVNGWKKKVYTVTNLTPKYGYLFSQGVEFIYSGQNLDGLGLNFRIFQGGVSELVRGEGTSKSADAVQGKVALHVFDDFSSGIVSKVNSIKGESVQLVQDPNSKNKKDKIWDWTSDGLAKFKKAQSAYKTVKGKGAKLEDTTTHGKWSDAFKSSDNFIKVLNNWKTKKQENSVKANINSRFQTLVLGAEVMNLGKQKREKVMLGLLKYGKSESEWSSAHYKAQ